ncbi:Monothiol glutaredoxin-S15, mitochondrial [Tetrabaena socialis]|uniref:Monothiol glutaredoxin-S15, mitochondrial n=1 Tax=Tetrabaena socialis TaxID=47790 RepID=A0A2J7ZRT4_9CHLO|nr:Monothiol glutaredoxin-S15, mitochondrial [Tetrabaena socialis]|eukprot:PNH02968.1 Monothiol glutaredoxin-S15, mitochondrial [Tetrabaena socialis]
MLARIAAGTLSRTRGAAPLRLLGRQLATEADSHDDFKPKITAPAAPTSVEEQIKRSIASDKVHVFMKGTPDSPQCGFSRMTCVVLQAYGVKFGSTNVLADAGVREGIKKFTSWPTIPQVFVDGEFVGGCDILMGMHDSGELEKLLDPVKKAQA